MIIASGEDEVDLEMINGVGSWGKNGCGKTKQKHENTVFMVDCKELLNLS